MMAFKFHCYNGIPPFKQAMKEVSENFYLFILKKKRGYINVVKIHIQLYKTITKPMMEGCRKISADYSLQNFSWIPSILMVFIACMQLLTNLKYAPRELFFREKDRSSYKKSIFTFPSFCLWKGRGKYTDTERKWSQQKPTGSQSHGFTNLFQMMLPLLTERILLVKFSQLFLLVDINPDKIIFTCFNLGCHLKFFL